MDRRGFLVASGVAITSGIGGCLADSDDSLANPDGDDTDTEGRDGAFPRLVRLVEYDEVPVAVPLVIEMEVTEERISAETTGQLRKTIESTHDRPVRFPRIYHKGWSKTASDPGILVYAMEARDLPTVAEAVHCVPGADPDASREASDMVDIDPPAHTDVDPGEVIEVAYRVADDWDTDTCFPPGTYRFEDDATITLDLDTGDTVEFHWGFTIEITNP